jgi:mRNA-degrading endonuclease YafQ of YafQ-DinJ toxin-antitoxin module
MTPLFSVQTSPHFERSFKKLRKQHPEPTKLFAEALDVLEIDPYNRTRRYQNQEAD